jgi:hypothetical protein
MSIFARSPYIVEISEALQTGSKINLFIWNGTGAAPTSPTYVLSKLIPASNNVKTYYNISPYIREFISWNTRQQPYNTYSASQTSQWCNVKIQKFKLSSGVYTQVGTDITLKAFDGFGYYEEGYNPSLTYDILHDQGTFNYAYDSAIDPNTNASYRGGFIMVQTGTSYKAKYTNLSTGATHTQGLANNQLTDVLRVYTGYYSVGNKLEILDTSNAVLWTAYFVPKLNCKYTPVLCDFVNKYGCWQRTYFYAASNDTFNIENTEYNLMQSTFPNYNTLEGQRKVFNTTAKKSIKVNTDWVEESYKDLLKQLMASERILINSLPVKINTKSTELFKSINTKTINYQLEFEFAFNAINNVI